MVESIQLQVVRSDEHSNGQLTIVTVMESPNETTARCEMNSHARLVMITASLQGRGLVPPSLHNLRSVGTLDVPTEYPSDLVKSSSQRSFYAVIWLRSTGEVRYIDQRDGSVIDLLKQYPD